MTYRFDAFVLDEGTRQLLRAGSNVHLSPKAFDLLAHLIRERPRALAKASLHTHLWPGTFVTDASLGMLVTEIRGALDDTALEEEVLTEPLVRPDAELGHEPDPVPP